MARYLSTVLRMLGVTVVILGVIYPLAITGFARLAFPRQASGSLILRDGRAVGSELIGQQFTDEAYFHPRPSAAGRGYDAAASSPSNLGPTNKALANQVNRNLQQALEENPDVARDRIPVDMVTTSASGLDPDVSPANAEAQIARVALVRGVSQDDVRHVVSARSSPRQFGFLGEPRVNVLKLNLALDAAFGVPGR